MSYFLFFFFSFESFAYYYFYLCLCVLEVHAKLYFCRNNLQGRFSSSPSLDTLQGPSANVDKYVPTGSSW